MKVDECKITIIIIIIIIIIIKLCHAMMLTINPGVPFTA